MWTISTEHLRCSHNGTHVSLAVAVILANGDTADDLLPALGSFAAFLVGFRGLDTRPGSETKIAGVHEGQREGFLHCL